MPLLRLIAVIFIFCGPSVAIGFMAGKSKQPLWCNWLMTCAAICWPSLIVLLWAFGTTPEEDAHGYLRIGAIITFAPLTLLGLLLGIVGYRLALPG